MTSSQKHVNGSTQYDTIATPYSSLYDNDKSFKFNPSFPAACIEEAQVFNALTKPPININDKNVLDMACGSGFYSRRFLSWGAKSVTGVDISPEMVKQARLDAESKSISNTKLRYLVGDVATQPPLQVSETTFDIVTGTWLLNYAPDVESMTRMWRCIGTNLTSGGWFVGLTIPPLSNGTTAADINGLLNPESRGECAKYGTSGHVVRPVKDGFEVHIKLGLSSGEEDAPQVNFDNFYLHASVFEDSLKASDMFHSLQWMPMVVPDELMAAVEPGYWNDAILFPHCRVVIAQRK